jgi:flagellar hook-associated protein 3 FlgL
VRITQNMLASQVLGNISGSMERLAKVQEQLSTTKRINRPSDDPLGSNLVVRFRSTKDALESFQRATGAAREQLRATEAPLTRVVEILQQARESAVQGSSDVMQGSRSALAAHVNQLLEDLVSLANGKYAGRYVFGGIQTTTPAFTATRDASQQITGVTANPLGIGQVIQAEVSEGFSMQANLPGDEVFTKDVDLFTTLIGLRDALAAEDTAAVAATLDDLDAGIKQVDAAVGMIGVAVQRLNAVEKRNQDDLTRVEKLRSQVEDADIAEVYLDLQRMQNAFQASLAAGARALQQSLLDFLI